MMNIDDLFSFDTIRSVLTVSDVDLPDELLSSYGLEDEIWVLLDRNVPQWETVAEGSGLARKIKVYVKYSAAAIIAVTAPVFILKKITDGDNEGQRSDRDGFLWLKNDLQNKANEMLDDILEELGVPRTPAVFTLTSLVTPARDVIIETRDS